MSDSNDDLEPKLDADGKPIVPPKEEPTKDDVTPEMQAKIDALADEKLKDIKAKLDKVHKDLADTRTENAKLLAKEREAELKALEEAGKFKEAAEMRIADAEARAKAADARVVELTRDGAIKTELMGHDFKNAVARDVAFAEIAKQLVQDEKGDWKTRKGETIAEAVEAMVKDENYAFLIKTKTSTGGGTGTVIPKTSDNTKTSLFDRPVNEVLEMARTGKLRRG